MGNTGLLNSMDGVTERSGGVAAGFLDYTISDNQAKWLEEELASDAHATFTFVHHPLWYSGYTNHPANSGSIDYPWMGRIHPILNGQVAYVFAGDGGGQGGFMFYEKLDQVDYYLTGSRTGVATFLHVAVNGNDTSVLPYFLDLQGQGEGGVRSTPAAAQPAPLELVLTLFKSRRFWAGSVFAVTVLGLGWIVITILRWQRLHRT